MLSTHIRAPVTLAILLCAGCVYYPPPSPPPPVAVAAAPAQVAQAGPTAAPTCREFQQTITVGGQVQEGWGTTCLQPDGSWKAVTAAQPGAPPPPPVVAAAPPPPPPRQVAVPVYPAYYPYPYSYSPPYAYGGGIIVRRGWR